MKFRDLISPKWKNSNPSVRLKAVKSMGNVDITILETIIHTDTDASVRTEALKKISIEELLIYASENDPDDRVKDFARAKLYNVYSDKIIASTDTNQRLAWLNLINDEMVVADLSPRIDNPDIRAMIAEKINTPKLLCQLAESNCGLKAGTVIISKITNPDQLQRISTHASGKKIRKLAADKLAGLQPKPVEEISSEPQVSNDSNEADLLCSMMSAALTGNKFETIVSSIEQADKFKNSLDSTTVLPETFHTLLANLKQSRKTIEHFNEIEKRINELLVSISQLTEKTEFSENDLKTANDLKQEYNSIPPDDAISSETDLKAAITTLDQQIERFKLRKEDEDRIKTELESLCRNAETLCNDSDIHTLGNKIENLQAAWNKTASSENSFTSLTDRFETLIDTCKQNLAAVEETAKKENELAVSELLETVRMASEQENKDLFKTAPDIKSAISKWKTLQTTDDQATLFHQYCDAFFEKLDAHKKNRDWELWANYSLKKELCETVEKLASIATEAENLTGLADRVWDIQKKWKEIGPVTKEKSDDLWDRFRSTCDGLFSRCLEEKKALFERVREAVEISNLNEASKIVIEIQQEWKQIGSLPLPLEKELRDEFQQTCNAFFDKKREFLQQQDAERAHNFDIKTDLCEQAEALLDSDVWNETTQKYKELQSSWKQIGPVPREKSDELWNRFSLACNTWFDTLEKKKPENLEIKKGLLLEAATIRDSVNDNETDIRDACRQAIELQKTWSKTGPVPQTEADTIWQEFRSTCDDIFATRDKIQEELSKDFEKNRLEKEELLRQAEDLATSGDWTETSDALKLIQEKWKDIGPAARKEDQILWKRFREINDRFFNRKRDHFMERDSQRQSNLTIKENLCLSLELLARITTEDPDVEYNKEVPLAEQLSKAREIRDSITIPGDVKGTRANAVKMVKDIQSKWKETGSVPSDKDSELWARYKKAGDLFYSR